MTGSKPTSPASAHTPQSFPSLQYTQEHKAVGLANPALGLHSRERIEACAQAVRARFPQPVDAAVILGTGLGALAQQMDVQVAIPRMSTAEYHAPYVAMWVDGVGQPPRTLSIWYDYDNKEE